MLTLIEPINMNGLSDRPHLGCAMLIAACQEKGIKTTLINGQTRYLRDMFLNGSDELWGLIQSLKDSDLEKIGIVSYKRSIQDKGVKQFRDGLKSLYQNVIIDKNARQYFNAQMREKLNNLHDIFVEIYSYYLRELKYENLRIIDRYVFDIIESNPRYIGFSLEGRFGPLSRAIRKRIKETAEIPIIVGGSLSPFIDLKKLDHIFKEEYFDYLVIGAGEEALPSLIEAIDNSREPRGIRNVFYKRNGEIRVNDLGVINHLDSLPYPDYSQFDLDLYVTPERILPLQTARGCTWRKCAFCTNHNIDLGNYKAFSIKRVIEAINHLENTYACSHFAFHDLDLPPQRAKRISEAIVSNNLKNVNIRTLCRLVDGYNNSTLLSLMRKAGFTLIQWGMESGNQRVFNIMNKGTTLKTMSPILKKSFTSGISNMCFVIFGFPGETTEEAQQTVAFLENHSKYIDDIHGGTFFLEPASHIGKNPERWNVTMKSAEGYSTKDGMSCEEANAFASRFMKEFEINSIRLASDKLKYLLPGFNREILHFLSSSHKLVTNTILLECLKKRKRHSIFPIILGEIKKKGSRTVLCPININEAKFINEYFPMKEILLDSLKERIFILSDGRLSIEEVILTICQDFKGRYRKECIYKKCTDFFRNIFSKNLGLAFAKSWR